jgi:hypothetical protein
MPGRLDPQDMWQWGWDRSQQNYGDVAGAKSSFAGLNTTGDVRSKFGIPTDTSSIYAPLRRRLATQRGGALSSAATRMRGGTALPESTMLPIEGEFAGAESSLASEEARSNIGQQDFLAQMLQSVLGEQDRFSLGKGGLMSSILGGMQGQVGQKRQQDYQLQDPTFGDYLMQIIGKGADVAGAAAGAPTA